MWRLYAVLLCCSISSPLWAQEPEVRTISFEGPEVFCHILNEIGLRPVADLNEKIDPKRTLIVLLGDPGKLHEIKKHTGGLNRYLQQGGSLLIATDHRVSIPDLPITITGERISRAKEMTYRNKSENCPLLNYVGDRRRPHPLFRGLAGMDSAGIATNCPSGIRIGNSDSLIPLLYFPFDPGEGVQLMGDFDNYMAGSTMDAPPQGRSLFIAGHGMFMNGMMLQEDNDNFAFTINAVQWLREGPDGSQRTLALVVVDGEVITNFDTKLAPPLPPIPMPTVRTIDRLLRGIENEAIIPRFIAEHFDVQRMAAVFLAFATFALLLYSAKKFMESRHLPETGVTLTVGPHASTLASVAPVIGKRVDALIRRNDLCNEARAAVHEWLHDQLGITPEHVELRAEASADSQLRRRVEFVMRLLRADEAMRVSRVEFRTLVETLPELAEAIKKQRVALLVQGKNVRQ